MALVKTAAQYGPNVYGRQTFGRKYFLDYRRHSKHEGTLPRIFIFNSPVEESKGWQYLENLSTNDTQFLRAHLELRYRARSGFIRKLIQVRRFCLNGTSKFFYDHFSVNRVKASKTFMTPFFSTLE